MHYNKKRVNYKQEQQQKKRTKNKWKLYVMAIWQASKRKKKVSTNEQKIASGDEKD